MKTPSQNAIQYATRPYLRAGYQIESIERGRVTLTRRVHERGSILVLVVVLLVLLALMGTAYITTTRTDRYSAEQNKANTQIDLLMDGVKQMAVSRVTNLPADYHNGLYLSPRHPQALGTTSTDPVAWPSIGIPLTLTAFSGLQLVDPTTGTITTPPPTDTWQANKDPYYFQPDSIVGGDGKTHPALVLMNESGQTIDYNFVGSVTRKFIAADTDGDGIADAFFFPVPGAAIDGLTYYAAVRIIDNNSALNVNTAWSQTDFDGNGNPVTNPNQGLFLTSTGLAEILGTYTTSVTINQGTEAQSLNGYRWGASQQNGVLGATGALACVYDDAGNKRETPSGSNTPDFQFSSQGAALNSQLSLRVDNPGKNGSANTYRSFPLSDSFLLSYPFAIRPPTSSVSMNSLETTLSTTLNSAHTAYAPNAAGTWFQDNFAWGDRTTTPADAATPSLGRRSYFVTRNPVSSKTTFASNVAVPANPTTPAHPVKADANTSDFTTLWRAYWGVMADPNNADQPRTVGDPMFKTSARGQDFVTAAVPPKNTEMLMLRSAIAAANTIALREGSATITNDVIPSFYIPLNSANTIYATVFGLKRQPFISKVIYERQVNESDQMVKLDNSLPGAGELPGYIAIEIYNPTPAAIADLSHYRVALYSRNTVAPYNLTVTVPADVLSFPAAAKIGKLPAVANDINAAPPPDQPRIIIQDGTRPASITLPAGVVAYDMPGLLSAVGKEAVLVRTRNPAGPTAGTMPPNNAPYDELLLADGGTGADAHIVNWVPLDQIDLRGLASLPALTHATVPDSNDPTTNYPVPNRDRRTYSRPNYDGITLPGGPAIPALLNGNPWECVYAGNYTTGSGHAFDVSGTGAMRGTTPAPDTSNPPDITRLTYTADDKDRIARTDPTANNGYLLGYASRAHIPALTAGAPNYSIEVNAFGTVGPNPWQDPASPKQFPFGGFARNGDLLQVPFIGSYKITDAASGNLVELNSVTIDAVKSNDVTTVIAGNQIGRFWPLNLAGSVYTNFDWAKYLFDYVTVQSPQNDYLPNIQSKPNTGVTYDDPNPTGLNLPSPQAVPNGPILSPAQANGTNEWSVGVNGLININTASWKVLSMLPLVVDTNGNVDNSAPNYYNDTVAKAIVSERKFGPFANIFDLYNRVRVSGALCFQTPPNGTLALDAAHGESMPNPTAGDRNFRQSVLQLTRISNLVTTRSDTFTVYILVQGWRNGALEVERRSAFYVDRTNLSTTNPNPIVVPIPTK